MNPDNSSTDKKEEILEKGLELIVKERQRQIDKEGYSKEHDSEHDDESLYYAAMTYEMGIKEMWPWKSEQYKPTGDWIKDLIKAGALYHAEVDRYTNMSEGDIDFSQERKKEACWAMAHCANRITAIQVLQQNGISTQRFYSSFINSQERERIKELEEGIRRARFILEPCAESEGLRADDVLRSLIETKEKL